MKKVILMVVGTICVVMNVGLLIWVIWGNLFPNLTNLIPIEQVSGGGICKSSILVKNLGTEDQVVLKDIIYEKDKYLGTYVSPNTVCSKIFYSNILGGYGPPTVTPTILSGDGEGQ